MEAKARQRRQRRLSCYDQLHNEKISRYLFTLSVVICIATIIYFGKIYGLMINQCVSMIMLILGIHFFISFSMVIYGFNSLHLMRVKRRRSSTSSALFIPYGLDHDVFKPMDSISAVIGLRGSNSEQIAGSILHPYGAMAFVVFLTNIDSNPDISSDICGIFAYLGGWLLCNFSLEHKSIAHDVIHFIGAGLYAFGSLIGYGLQQHFSMFSNYLILTTIISLLFYGLVKFMKFEDSKCVHYQSMLMIGFESVAIICAMAANVLQVWNLKYAVATR